MNRWILVFLLATAAPAVADDNLAERGAKKAGNLLDRSGKAIERGAKRTAKAAKRPIDATGKFLDRTGRKIDRVTAGK